MYEVKPGLRVQAICGGRDDTRAVALVTSYKGDYQSTALFFSASAVILRDDSATAVRFVPGDPDDNFEQIEIVEAGLRAAFVAAFPTGEEHPDLVEPWLRARGLIPAGTLAVAN